MSTTTSPRRTPSVRAPFSRPNKVGLLLAGLLGALDMAALAFPTPAGEVGPPLGILVLSTVLGITTVVAVGLAWRTGSRGLVRLAAGARILSTISALPAFFAGVPDAVVAMVSVQTLLTVTAVVLMVRPARRLVDVEGRLR